MGKMNQNECRNQRSGGYSRSGRLSGNVHKEFMADQNILSWVLHGYMYAFIKTNGTIYKLGLKYITFFLTQ